MTSVIEVKALTKKYDDVLALKGVNLTLNQGKVYGLIGRNGAGKTTLLKLLSNMLNITSGEIIYNEEVIRDTYAISFARDANYYYSNHKLKVLIDLARNVYPKWNEEICQELIDIFELELNKRYIKSSKGMQTMVSIIIALASGSDVILLDEPYAGLDPINREHFYSYLRNNFFNGEKTIVISSHLIKEIEGYFERAIIIDKGQILIDEEMSDIHEKSFQITCDEACYQHLLQEKNVLKYETLSGHYVVQIYDTLSTEEQTQLVESGAVVESMDLQTLFIALCMKGGRKNDSV